MSAEYSNESTPTASICGNQVATSMISLLFNFAIPIAIMRFLNGEDRLGAINALLFALMFPLGYGIYELIKTRKVGWIPIMGLIGVALNGVIGLFQLPGRWVAIKEAMIPGILAMVIIISAWIGRPLARVFIDAIIDKDKIYPILEAEGRMEDYQRRTGVVTWMLAGTFILSATLNFILAKVKVTAEGGTEQYTRQISDMTTWSLPVITVPVFIALTASIMYIMSTLSKLTGLEMDEVLKEQGKKKPRA